MLIIVIPVLVIIGGIAYKNTVYNTQVFTVQEENLPEAAPPAEVEPAVEVKAPEMITVYVCGSVQNPTNVTLAKDSRVEEAILLAGGLLKDADINGINMAEKLADEDMVYVPKKGETVQSPGKTSGGAGTGSNAKKAGKLNINKATAGELDALPGVGPSTAQKIIDYRSKAGAFKAIEELKNVSGIGDAKFDSLKDLITVN